MKENQSVTVATTKEKQNNQRLISHDSILYHSVHLVH